MDTPSPLIEYQAEIPDPLAFVRLFGTTSWDPEGASRSRRPPLRWHRRGMPYRLTKVSVSWGPGGSSATASYTSCSST